MTGDDSINIWYVERDGVHWSDPKKLNSVINTDESYTSSPSFASDGTMYFNSRRDDGHGKGDMYCSKFENGQPTSPINLGQNVNTEDNEYGGCIAPDGSYLLFSRFTENPKGVDIYISFKKRDGSWTEACAMGDTIGLCKKARFPGISPDGKYVFFCATRDRDVKVYWVDASIIEKLKPDTMK
jgi:Tol biopolymer transport system component